MTPRVIARVARVVWPPAVIAAAAHIVLYTADMAERTADPMWDRFRVLIALVAVAVGVTVAHTTRRTRNGM